jgi:ABC-type multidrug transport system fused ATPase/permease subunit
VYGEYGYMEEGRLGRPYDLRLLRRLGRYGIPYKKTMAVALLLTIGITLLDLALPYLSKIAIDRYILSSWYALDIRAAEPREASRLLEKYGGSLVRDRGTGRYFISNLRLKDIDPADLAGYRSAGVVEKDRYYRVEKDRLHLLDPPGVQQGRFEMEDGSLIVPYATLASLPQERLVAIRDGDIRGVTLIGLLFLGLLLASFALSYGEYYLLEWTGQRIMQDIRLQLFRIMSMQSLRFFERHPVGRLVTRVTNDIENLNEMFKSVVITVFKDLFILTGILGVLFYLNWRMALLCLALLPLVFGTTFLFSTLAREAFRELRAKVAKLNAFLQERITGMRVIQLFVQEGAQRDRFESINRENYVAGMKQIKVFAVFMPIMEIIASVGLALLLWYGGGRVIQEELTLGALVAFIQYIQMFFKPIRDISEKYNIMQSAMASTERIFEFMDHREHLPEPERAYRPPGLSGHIEFDRVSFSYLPGVPVVRDVSFEVRPGEMVAIVGATGSGKTTLIHLLERFYDPDDGEIRLDGVSLRQWDTGELRRHIRLVMQDVFLFSGTVGENIALGMGRLDAGTLERAAGEANALGFIERLPGGFEHEIGEGGGTLSGGERQLLSFARALAGAPRILVLDEATSSVDPETERLIQEAIMRMTARRTTLVVAHRLSTIRSADRILVMHRGRMVEQGTHDALLAKRGIYYRLSRMQEEAPPEGG